MPKTIKEWLWFIALGFCLLYPSISKADDLMDCVARGRAAFVMVMGMATGVPLDQVNVYFSVGNQMVTDEEYINGIREEVRPLLGVVPAADTPEAEPYAARIGNKIAEACAYNYGARFRKTASSEAVADREGVRTAQCSELLTDQRYIAERMAESIPTQRLLQQATRSVGELGEERLKRIMGLIAETDAAARKAVREWFEAYWHACMDGV